MKKVLLIVCAVSFSLGITAQSVNGTWKNFKETKESSMLSAKPTNDLRRQASSDWYFPMFTSNSGLDGYYGVASPNPTEVRRFVGFLFPDSTVMNLTNTSATDPTIVPFGHAEHSWGIVFDPMDDYIANYGQDQYSQHQSYMWDSVQFNFGYIQQIDSFMDGGVMKPVVDTMIVRYYTFQDAGLTTGLLIRTATGDTTGSFARPRSWSAAAGYATSNFKSDTIALTADLATTRTSTGWGTRGVSLPVEKMINSSTLNLSNRLIGFTVHFKPSLEYSAGDTLIDLSDEWETNTPPVKRNNYLVSTYYNDQNPENSQLQSPLDDFTTSLRLNKFSRYSTSGWQGYVPGTAFNDDFYWLGGVNISTQTLSTRNLESIGAEVGNPYPNPASQDVVSIPVTTKSATNVIVSVTDISGREVINTTNNINGAGNVQIDASALSAGIYNINVSIDGISTTKKLVVK